MDGRLNGGFFLCPMRISFIHSIFLVVSFYPCLAYYFGYISVFFRVDVLSLSSSMCCECVFLYHKREVLLVNKMGLFPHYLKGNGYYTPFTTQIMVCFDIFKLVSL